MTKYTSGIYMYEHLKDHPFKIYETYRNFTSCGTLSKANIPLQLKQEDDLALVVRLHELIDFETDLFLFPENRPKQLAVSFEQLIKILKKNKTTQLKKNLGSKREVLVELSKIILMPLFESIVFESSYKTYLKSCGLEEASCNHLGIGSKETWYGEPDMSIQDVYVLSEENDEEENDDEEEEEEDDKEEEEQQSLPVFLECKKKITKVHRSQFVATSILGSFMQHNIDPTNNAFIPTILMNQSCFKICMYNAKHDVLLISAAKELNNIKGELSTTAILLLWLMENLVKI